MARTLRGTALLLALSVVVGGALPAATAGPVAAAALASPVASASVATAKATIKKKTTTNLNLRQKPTASSKSLLVIPTGVTLTVLKKSGTWEQVKYASKTGWVSGKYLTSTSAPKAAVYRYAQSYQELRASASAKSKSLGAVARKTKVQYLGASGSWSKVKVSGKTGFVPSNQLGVTAPAASYRWLTSKQTGYKSASTKSSKVVSLAAGTKVEWLRSSGSWSQVSTAKGPVWVASKQLSTSAPKAAVYRYAQSYQELRASASAKSKSLGAVARKTKVQYLGASGSWSKVKVSGKTGFVPSNQLGVKAPAASYRWLTSKQTGYKSASTKSSKVVSLAAGTKVEWLRSSGSWSQVSTAKGPVWVASKQLSTSAPKAAVYRYAQSYQELRASASAKSKSLGAVARKTKVQYLGASGSWGKVKVSGKTGFVPSNQLGVKAPAASYRWLTSKQTGYKSASTKSSKVVSLAAGTKVEWLRSSGSWSQVSTAKGPVWVASKQLSASAPKPPAKPTPQAPKVIGQRWFVDPTAVRKSASTTAGSLGTVPAGQKVDLLQSKGSWSQVKTSKGTGWVPTSSLITTAYTPVSGQYRWTTTNLNLRSGAGTMYKSVGVLPTGERLTVKGTSAGWSRVQTSKGIGWVSSSYLSTKAPAATAPTQQPAPPKPQAPRPEAIQYRWTTANLNLRTGAGTSYPSKAVVPQAEKVTYLKADSGWAYISSTKGTGWVSERYLSTSGPATVQPDTRAVMKAVQQRFAGYYTSMGTLRSGSVGHSSGRAVDIMIRNYKDPQSIAAGNRIAQFLLDNRMELGVEYLIWRDKIWLPTTGWTEYSKSGKYGTQFTGNWNDTTLHNDHVHVETYGNAATGGKLDDSAVR